ncbi:hypothetical protein K461DRAFT_310320 [Myriangium duriaei CBS 260.36]|uniref:Uncharacterized protein n=1 Tax=Myriangium duriaei CBS 260.36 TaxID=1168546 RepID=A0A9P4JAY3_9PEZI|nr:hypothetical protein K461DRAFT_310320 [Myriangium duriaei CBS 260.36]
MVTQDVRDMEGDTMAYMAGCDLFGDSDDNYNDGKKDTTNPEYAELKGALKNALVDPEADQQETKIIDKAESNRDGHDKPPVKQGFQLILPPRPCQTCQTHGKQPDLQPAQTPTVEQSKEDSPQPQPQPNTQPELKAAVTGKKRKRDQTDGRESEVPEKVLRRRERQNARYRAKHPPKHLPQEQASDQSKQKASSPSKETPSTSAGASEGTSGGSSPATSSTTQPRDVAAPVATTTSNCSMDCLAARGGGKWRDESSGSLQSGSSTIKRDNLLRGPHAVAARELGTNKYPWMSSTQMGPFYFPSAESSFPHTKRRTPEEMVMVRKRQAAAKLEREEAKWHKNALKRFKDCADRDENGRAPAEHNGKKPSPRARKIQDKGKAKEKATDGVTTVEDKPVKQTAAANPPQNPIHLTDNEVGMSPGVGLQDPCRSVPATRVIHPHIAPPLQPHPFSSGFPPPFQQGFSPYPRPLYPPPNLPPKLGMTPQAFAQSWRPGMTQAHMQSQQQAQQQPRCVPAYPQTASTVMQGYLPQQQPWTAPPSMPHQLPHDSLRGPLADMMGNVPSTLLGGLHTGLANGVPHNQQGTYADKQLGDMASSMPHTPVPDLFPEIQGLLASDMAQNPQGALGGDKLGYVAGNMPDYLAHDLHGSYDTNMPGDMAGDEQSGSGAESVDGMPRYQPHELRGTYDTNMLGDLAGKMQSEVGAEPLDGMPQNQPIDWLGTYESKVLEEKPRFDLGDILYSPLDGLEDFDGK